MPEPLLRISLDFTEFKLSVLAFVTSFISSMLVMPVFIKLINHFRLFDIPDLRKEHQLPIPTMGGIAFVFGMMTACILWYHFHNDIFTISFFFSVAVLMTVGVMDDLKNMSARYKLGIQIAVASMIAFSGIRLTSFNGFLGIYELPLSAQYSLTILAIAGITNAFNLIDGIDGLAGGLGFMSLTIIGIFLTLNKDYSNAVIAFALGGGLLGFLYYNFNPARIFMGDTGSLVLGFVIAVLCVRLIQQNSTGLPLPFSFTPIFALSIVAIPVFDTLRVFFIRLWQGRSPFSPDKNHIHHLLINNGWTHSLAARIIWCLHAFILITGYFLKYIDQVSGLLVLLSLMLIIVYTFQKIKYKPQVS